MPRTAPLSAAVPMPAGTVVRDSRGHGRETVESIVVALTLALIFKAFEAEAFVIPTGSMAPTLMGRHKDLVCGSCREAFRVGCSREVDEAAGRINAVNAPTRADCPNCGQTSGLDRRGVRWLDPTLDSFNGDRILVDKIAYDFREPARWDVVVFKYPEDAKTNYIKRLVGLPGENVTIAGGDIWTSRDGGPPVIARKPPRTLLAMLQCVHDSRHVAADLARAGWPTAWADWSPADADARCRWETADAGRSFQVSCADGAEAMLRFRRLLPTDAERAALATGAAADAVPAFIGDFQAYNDGRPTRLRRRPGDAAAIDGDRWVGDLAVEVDLESRGEAGLVTLDLVEAGQLHACTIDLADGSATLARSAADGGVEATARTAVRGRGRWRILFANVDDELSLFIDGRKVSCDRPATWAGSVAVAAAARPVAGGSRPGETERGDLAPAGVTARGANVRVSGLRVLRDVYYIASGDGYVMNGSRPEPPQVSYPLEADQFFMLGDNSAASADSRFWRRGPHVDRHLIVGRALAVFWPHGVPTGWSIPLRIGTWELRLPFLPNFARMRFVR
jgi:signal peptidase I